MRRPGSSSPSRVTWDGGAFQSDAPTANYVSNHAPPSMHRWHRARRRAGEAGRGRRTNLRWAWAVHPSDRTLCPAYVPGGNIGLAPRHGPGTAVTVDRGPANPEPQRSYRYRLPNSSIVR